MGFRSLRGIIQPLSRTLASPSSIISNSSKCLITAAPLPNALLYRFPFAGGLLHIPSPWTRSVSGFHSLTDTRFPKRRPVDKPRRKRASLKPPGPYAWVKYVPGEPILPNQPNEGSVKRRNEKKRMRLRHAFILAEAKKRKVQVQEAKRKKLNQRVERKMAAVARDREWAQRLAELQKLEQDKKRTTTTTTMA